MTKICIIKRAKCAAGSFETAAAAAVRGAIHTYIHTNRENRSEALAQDDYTVKADWKRLNFRWRLKVCR